jgi:hypothetical protein
MAWHQKNLGQQSSIKDVSMAKMMAALKKWGPMLIFALVFLVAVNFLTPEIKDSIIKYLSF